MTAIRGEGKYRGPIQIQSNALATLEAIEQQVRQSRCSAERHTGSSSRADPSPRILIELLLRAAAPMLSEPCTARRRWQMTYSGRAASRGTASTGSATASPASGTANSTRFIPPPTAASPSPASSPACAFRSSSWPHASGSQAGASSATASRSCRTRTRPTAW